MASFKWIRCAIKFQLCVGHFPDGRMRTRTFGIGGVRPDLSADDVTAVARAVAPLLAHPIVRVRFVRKYALETPSRRGARIEPETTQRHAIPGEPRETPALREGILCFYGLPSPPSSKIFWRKNPDVV